MSINLIFKYFPNLTSNSKKKMEQLFPLYGSLNKKVNLISRKDFIHFYERHVLHSLSISKIIQFSEGTDIMDIGTGGGFPGIPLAILFPNSNFVLVDSIRKKIECLVKIKKQLHLKNVEIIHSRGENVSGAFDFVISRAVSPLKKIDFWTKGKIKKSQKNHIKNGLILLKGGDLKEETKGLEDKIEVFEIYNFFKEDFFRNKKIIHLR